MGRCGHRPLRLNRGANRENGTMWASSPTVKSWCQSGQRDDVGIVPYGFKKTQMANQGHLRSFFSKTSGQKETPAQGKIAHLFSNRGHIRYPDSRLRDGSPAAHRKIRLMLLDSSPDMVHGILLRRTGSSTLLIRVRQYSLSPRKGIHPCYSGLQVTGHR